MNINRYLHKKSIRHSKILDEKLSKESTEVSGGIPSEAPSVRSAQATAPTTNQNNLS
jgi:hypothetical protein